MENLMLRMESELSRCILLAVGCLVILIVEARKLWQAVVRLDTSKKQKKKSLHEAVRKSRRDVIICCCLLAAAIALGGVTARDYLLDKGEEPQVIEGLVTSAHYNKSGRHSPRRYRVIIDDGSAGKGMQLYIDSSLIDDYAIEEGETYRMTYYPRTNTLCEAEKLD